MTKEEFILQRIAYDPETGKLFKDGVFETKEAAHEAYCRAAKEVFGEFARAA